MEYTKLLMQFLIIFLGSGLGGLLRFLLGSYVQKVFDGWIFPIGTFSVNMLGCLVIGFLARLAEAKGLFQGEVRLLIFVGFLGGFTTFSSFGYETFQLLRDGEILQALLNAGLQVVLGVLLVWLGYIIGFLV